MKITTVLYLALCLTGWACLIAAIYMLLGEEYAFIALSGFFFSVAFFLKKGISHAERPD